MDKVKVTKVTPEFSNVLLLAKKLNKTITIFDTETTGLGKPEDIGVCNLAFISIHPNETMETFETLLNPGMPIPGGASKVHGIYDHHVVDAKKFHETDLPRTMQKVFSEHVISGFNSTGYDSPIILSLLSKAGKSPTTEQHYLDVRMVWTQGNKYGKGKLVDVAKQLGIDGLDMAHNALGDVLMTAKVLNTLIEKQGSDYVLQYQTKPTPAQKEFELQVQTRVPTKNEAKERAIRNVLEKTNTPFLRSAYRALGESIGMTAQDISFGVSEMIANNRVDLDRIRDVQENELILNVLPQVMADEAAKVREGVSVRLTPILKNLVGNHGINTDFVQLRIAMKDLADRDKPKPIRL